MEDERMKCLSRHKRTPREASEKAALRRRLSRIAGQLNGIARMVEEDRYCGDILIQIAAAANALRAVGQTVLRTHLRTCVADDLRAGDERAIDEVGELFRKLR